MWELDYKDSWWCWRRLFKVPWTARRSIQSILKEVSPEYSLEGLMLKLKLQYFGHLMWRTDSVEKTLMLGKIEGGRRRGQQRMRWLDGITDSMDEFEQALGAGDGQGSVTCCSPWGLKESDMTERLNWTNWTECILQIKTQNPTVEPSVTALGYLLHLLCSVHLRTSIHHIEPWAHLLSTSSARLSCSYTSQCPQGWLVESMNNISKTVIVDFYLVSSLRINTQDHVIKEQPGFYFYHLSSCCKDSLMFPKKKKNVNNSITGWTFF